MTSRGPQFTLRGVSIREGDVEHTGDLTLQAIVHDDGHVTLHAVGWGYDPSTRREFRDVTDFGRKPLLVGPHPPEFIRKG